MVAKEWTQFTFCQISNLIIDAVQLLHRSSMRLQNSRPQIHVLRFSQLTFLKISSYHKVDVLNVSEASELAGIWEYSD